MTRVSLDFGIITRIKTLTRRVGGRMEVDSGLGLSAVSVGGQRLDSGLAMETVHLEQISLTS